MHVDLPWGHSNGLPLLHMLKNTSTLSMVSFFLKTTFAGCPALPLQQQP